MGDHAYRRGQRSFVPTGAMLVADDLSARGEEFDFKCLDCGYIGLYVEDFVVKDKHGKTIKVCCPKCQNDEDFDYPVSKNSRKK